MVKKANLLEELEALQQAVKGSQVCRCCLVVSDADEELRDALQSALDNPRINASTIGKWLRSKGFQCSDFSVRRHRRGECQ